MATPAFADETLGPETDQVSSGVDEDEVWLEGSRDPSGGTSGGTGPADTEGDGSRPPVVVVNENIPRLCDAPSGQCQRPDIPPPPAEPGAPTITDIATFPVSVGSAHNQPTGWGVVGMPTNFYATGGVHEVSGTLLGQPATVRFTPVAWHWDYGDGGSASLGTPGAPWSTSTQLRPTPTSHVYGLRGDYTVTLLIDYAAEYQYAGEPWMPVAGVLRVRANDLTITTWRVKSVLVAEDCIDDPTGPGCPGTR